MYILRYNNLNLDYGGRRVCVDDIGPAIPQDMDFIYLAKNFDGTKVINKVPNSTFGDYLQYGTLTVNGEGASCYLSNGLSDSNYLYKNLTSTELDNIQAINSTYTFFIRVMSSNGTGGIMSTRAYGVISGDHYVYMIRSYNNQLQIHTTGGNNLGSNFLLDTDRVYKVVINGSSFYAKNLETNADTTITFSTQRNMSTYMTTFWAGFTGEAKLDRFYGMAGIPRATTTEEDSIIKDILMNQSI